MFWTFRESNDFTFDSRNQHSTLQVWLWPILIPMNAIALKENTRLTDDRPTVIRKAHTGPLKKQNVWLA